MEQKERLCYAAMYCTPAPILREKRLTPVQKIIFVFLYTRLNTMNCLNITDDEIIKIAEELDINKRHIIPSLKKFSKLGYLTVTQLILKNEETQFIVEHQQY